jgi:hypothetical protein
MPAPWIATPAIVEAAANVLFGFAQDNGGHGYVHADFDSGDFEVMCPEVLVAIQMYFEFF